MFTKKILGHPLNFIGKNNHYKFLYKNSGNSVAVINSVIDEYERSARALPWGNPVKTIDK